MTRLIRYEFYKLFCRQSILAVLILFSVINLFNLVFPYIGLSKTSIYRLPLLFLLGTDFFAGDLVSNDALTGDEKIVFAEVDAMTLLILL